jgi:K+-transporting ATPase ATPase B chain
VLFANFAEAMAEGRSKAQAAALRSMRTTMMANQAGGAAKYGGSVLVPVPATLRKGDHRAGEGGRADSRCDGEVIEGVGVGG